MIFISSIIININDDDDYDELVALVIHFNKLFHFEKMTQ